MIYNYDVHITIYNITRQEIYEYELDSLGSFTRARRRAIRRCYSAGYLIKGDEYTVEMRAI